MSLWSWFFPTPEDRLRKGQRLLERGRTAEARLELLDNPLPEAVTLLHQAENHLAKLNLEEAHRRSESGDDLGAADHLELAERFHHGGLEEAFRQTRRDLRAHRLERREQAEREQAAKEAQIPPGLRVEQVPEGCARVPGVSAPRGRGLPQGSLRHTHHAPRSRSSKTTCVPSSGFVPTDTTRQGSSRSRTAHKM